MTRWLDLVECEVAPVGSNFIPQELTRQRPVVDHCVPGSVDGDYDIDIGQTQLPMAMVFFTVNDLLFFEILYLAEAWLVAGRNLSGVI